MSELCNLHGKTGVGETGEYLPPETDRQVGLGVLGLANLLRRYGVTYEEFGDALWDVLNETLTTNGWSIAHDIVSALQNGIQQAAFIAKEHKMERAFAIAPTASCSYRSRDLDGYTCTPEIAPPIARTVDRDSGTFGVETYSYGEVEIASEVGWDNYNRVVNGIVEMYSRTGLWHSYSYNTWSDMVTYDREFIEEWLVGPQTSMYYALQVMADTQDKTDAYAALEESHDLDDYLGISFEMMKNYNVTVKNDPLRQTISTKTNMDSSPLKLTLAKLLKVLRKLWTSVRALAFDIWNYP